MRWGMLLLCIFFPLTVWAVTVGGDARVQVIETWVEEPAADIHEGCRSPGSRTNTTVCPAPCSCTDDRTDSLSHFYVPSGHELAVWGLGSSRQTAKPPFAENCEVHVAYSIAGGAWTEAIGALRTHERGDAAGTAYESHYAEVGGPHGLRLSAGDAMTLRFVESGLWFCDDLEDTVITVDYTLSPEPIPVPAGRRQKYAILIGDSWMDEIWGGASTPPYTLSEALEIHLGNNYEVIPRGCSGSRAEQWGTTSPAATCGNARTGYATAFGDNLTTQTEQGHPFLVILNTGVNDDAADRTAAQYRADVQEIITQVASVCPSCMVQLNCPPFFLPGFTVAESEAYCAELATLAGSNANAYLGADIPSLWNGTWTSGGHPTDVGVWKWAEFTADAVKAGPWGP